jgi:hypothetical protein
VKIPDQQLSYHLVMLKAIGKSGLGELAQTSGLVLSQIAKPKAISVVIKLTGLEEESFIEGREYYRQALSFAINDYGLTDFSNRSSLPNTLQVTLDDGKTISAAIIKILGTPIGYMAAISDSNDDGIFPLSETVWLCSSQLSLRLNAIMGPYSSMEAEVLGRQILTALDSDGVKSLTIGLYDGIDNWVSIYRDANGISARSIERLPQDQISAISDGETIGENTLQYLWSDSKVVAGLWVSSDSGYNLALGFEDRKLASPNIAAKVKEYINKKYWSDAGYLAKSFEKLKVDFKKLVKSERAAAITETTVTINHEINNPLTAILGNTQLMLMSRDKFPADVITKLETIERSAIKIRETTTKLMSIIDPVTMPYASGLEMIDIEKSIKKPKND